MIIPSVSSLITTVSPTTSDNVLPPFILKWYITEKKIQNNHIVSSILNQLCYSLYQLYSVLWSLRAYHKAL